MFVFEDCKNIDDRGVREMLKEISNEDLTLALRGASDDLKEKFFKNMSERAGNMAAREVGLAVGEPPTTKGYTPSVFAQLPKLLERAGRSAKGTITGIYTVLVDGDDFNEPIADSVRSILDGHIVLTRDLADQGHFPAIDVLRSISRLRSDICDRQDVLAGRVVTRCMSTFRRVEDMINIGAYAKGSNAEIDAAIAKMPDINAFLRQDVGEPQFVEQCMAQMRALADMDDGQQGDPQGNPQGGMPVPQQPNGVAPL